MTENIILANSLKSRKKQGEKGCCLLPLDYCVLRTGSGRPDLIIQMPTLLLTFFRSALLAGALETVHSGGA